MSASTANIEADSHVQVVAAIIRDDRGRILIARRPDNSHQGGKWEFPGGKIKPGEEALAALKRELLEEIGITVQQASPLMRVRYTYPERAVQLHIYRIIGFRGNARGREGQAIKWVPVPRLQDFVFPPADLPVLRALALPEVYAISASDRFRPEVFYPRLERALKQGIRLVQLRAHTLDDTAYRECAVKAREICWRYGARLLLNREPQVVEQCGADGIHLSSRQLLQMRQRPLPASKLVAASCHNQEELHQAETVGADFVVLSPVLPTGSHPGARPLGWTRFEEMSRFCSLPVYALGGMQPGDLGQAQLCGALGVAMVSALWENF